MKFRLCVIENHVNFYKVTYVLDPYDEDNYISSIVYVSIMILFIDISFFLMTRQPKVQTDISLVLNGISGKFFLILKAASLLFQCYSYGNLT